MLVKKITEGYVVQVFDDYSGRWVSQKFVTGDSCEYEGKLPRQGTAKEPYLNFDMVQPD